MVVGDDELHPVQAALGQAAQELGKDSWDGINFANGNLAEPLPALAEVPGYAYAVYRARSQLATPSPATPARRAAETSGRPAPRRGFDMAFWIPELEWYAVALDRDPRQVDALASNIGSACGPASWTLVARRRRRADDVAGTLLRMGHPHPRLRDGRL